MTVTLRKCKSPSALLGLLYLQAPDGKSAAGGIGFYEQPLVDPQLMQR
jgi:hypothetical protein